MGETVCVADVLPNAVTGAMVTTPVARFPAMMAVMPSKKDPAAINPVVVYVVEQIPDESSVQLGGLKLPVTPTPWTPKVATPATGPDAKLASAVTRMPAVDPNGAFMALKPVVGIELGLQGGTPLPPVRIYGEFQEQLTGV